MSDSGVFPESSLSSQNCRAIGQFVNLQQICRNKKAIQSHYTYRISANMYWRWQYIRPNSKKNSLHGNYIHGNAVSCAVRLHLRKLHCAVASCNVRANPILVITSYLRFCSAFSGNIACFLAIMKEITISICFLKLWFCSSNMEDFSNFWQKNHFRELFERYWDW